MSPCRVQPARSSQRSVAKTLPSIFPRNFTDFALTSPRMNPFSAIVSVPVESIEPLRNLYAAQRVRRRRHAQPVRVPEDDLRRSGRHVRHDCGWVRGHAHLRWRVSGRRPRAQPSPASRLTGGVNA